jgi:organic hydroperoxide reductase OsmC/OhrA
MAPCFGALTPSHRPTHPCRMSHTHLATVEWRLNGPDFRQGRYSREHTWSFDGGVTVPASASPDIVPAPWSSAAPVDPEEAFVAAIASCHMLWWLSLAAKHGHEVVAYRDEAVGAMSRDGQGKLWVSAVTLCPRILYGARAATPAEEARLHELAHAECFIARSVKTAVTVASFPAPPMSTSPDGSGESK